MRVMVDVAAGVRIRSATRASRLHSFYTQSIELAGLAPALPAFAELLIDGTHVDNQQLDGPRDRLHVERELLEITVEVPATVSFDELRSADKVVELWFRDAAVVDFRAIEVDAPMWPAPQDHRPRCITVTR